MAGGAPRLFSRRNVTGQLLDWSMRQEALKVQLFRLIDVLPALESPREIARHARDYLGGSGLPWMLRLGLEAGAKLPALLAFAARQGVRQMAGNFILAASGGEAVPKLGQLR